MNIADRIKTVQADFEALDKRRKNLIAQVERLREELARVGEEILRCQGSYQILKELEDEQKADDTQPKE